MELWSCGGRPEKVLCRASLLLLLLLFLFRQLLWWLKFLGLGESVSSGASAKWENSLSEADKVGAAELERVAAQDSSLPSRPAAG